MTTETMGTETEIETIETEAKRPGRVADRDFTTVSETHRELAQYVNANSGLKYISAGHVKAVLALRSDFVNSPEQQAKLAQRKEERALLKEQRVEEKAARDAQYEGLTSDQIKAVKKAERLAQKAADAQAEADRLLGQ